MVSSDSSSDESWSTAEAVPRGANISVPLWQRNILLCTAVLFLPLVTATLNLYYQLKVLDKTCKNEMIDHAKKIKALEKKKIDLETSFTKALEKCDAKFKTCTTEKDELEKKCDTKEKDLAWTKEAMEKCDKDLMEKDELAKGTCETEKEKLAKAGEAKKKCDEDLKTCKKEKSDLTQEKNTCTTEKEKLAKKTGEAKKKCDADLKEKEQLAKGVFQKTEQAKKKCDEDLKACSDQKNTCSDEKNTCTAEKDKLTKEAQTKANELKKFYVCKSVYCPSNCPDGFGSSGDGSKCVNNDDPTDQCDLGFLKEDGVSNNLTPCCSEGTNPNGGFVTHSKLCSALSTGVCE